MKMMVVDDSNIIRTRIARIAADPRLPKVEMVGQAKNGVEALTVAQWYKPEVVTMDLTMPEMDGITCIERLQRMDADIKILVVSALSDKTTAIAALKKGAQGFLHKPFSDEQLVMALLELIR